MQAIHRIEIRLRLATVVGHGSIDIGMERKAKRHHGAETVSKQSYLARALGQRCNDIDRIGDVSQASVAIVRLVQAQPMVPGFLRSHIEVNTGLLPPEEIRRNRDEAQLGQVVAVFADVGIDPEQLLQNDNGGRGQVSRTRNVGCKAAVPASVASVVAS